MLIRFEYRKPQPDGSRSKTVDCRKFESLISKSGRQHVIRPDGDEEEYILSTEQDDHFYRAFVMNDRGDTIETIHAPFSQARQA